MNYLTVKLHNIRYIYKIFLQIIDRQIILHFKSSSRHFEHKLEFYHFLYKLRLYALYLDLNHNNFRTNVPY